MERNSIIPASYGIFIQNDQILFVKRANSGYFDGYYSLPAGHVEEHEKPIEALVREMNEELGVVVRVDDVSLAVTSYRVQPDQKDRIDFFFLISAFEGEITNREPHKIADLQWASLSEIPEQTIPYIRDILQSIVRGESFIESTT